LSLHSALGASERRRARFASFITAGLVLSGLPLVSLVPATAASAAPACKSSARPDAKSARALARTCAKPVLVTDERTETTTVVANADGTYTSTEYADPHYVRMIDGTWRVVDTNLHEQPDGSFGPIASPSPVSLSSGGDAVLARQISNQQELVWTWPLGTLPTPRIDADTATYPNVLPDVDLVVRVDVYGFSDVFVVKSAAAATDPRLAQITFALSGNGMSAAGLAGTATSIDTAVEDFTIGEASMWDSTVSAAGTIDPDAPPEDATDATLSDSNGPGSGAQQAVVPTRVEGHNFMLVPDHAMLTSATTTFPVFIDPKSSAPVRSSWTMINKGHASQSYWSYDRADHAKVGNAGDGTNMYRSLFQFSTSAWKGKHVTAAEFHVGLKHSWSCSNTSTEIHISSSATIGSGTTWTSNSGTWGASLDTASNQNCHDASGVDTEWNSSALTSGVASKAGASTIVVGLRAANESSAASGWKKFDESSGAGGARLSVTYNTAPTASGLLLDGSACKTSSSSPALLSTSGSPAHNPVPKVTVKDGEADKSKVTFTYPKAGGGTATSTMSNVTSGATAQLSAGIPAAGIPSGSTVYSWKVTVSDGVDSSTAGPCYFRIDNTIPAPPVVTPADNRYVDDGEIHGGIGQPGEFTIAGTSGITKYVWGPEPGEPSNTVTTTNGAPVRVAFTPTEVGLNGIQVIGYNAVGTPSAVGALSFLVGGPTEPTGHWALNGDGTDTGTAPHDLTPSAVGWTANGRQVGTSVGTFNGTTSAATADPATIDTSTSFAVAAWVRPHAILGTNDTVLVSQDGADGSGFHLGTRSVSGAAHWSFLMKDTSAQSSTTRAAYATAALGTADVNRWALLVGVYDWTSGQIRLYVNGALAATTARTVAPWKATGNFVVGRGFSATATPGLWFNGDVADVRVWSRVAYQADVDALSEVALAGRWNLFDTSGYDSTNRNPLSFFNGPTMTFDEVHAVPALNFDSAKIQYALSSGPAVRTDTSYTVSAWVQPAVISTTGTDGYMTAVSQDGVNTSGLQLQFRNDGSAKTPRWCLTGRSSDVSTSSTNPPAPATPMACAQVSKGSTVVSPVAGTWTHLAGVYDANRSVLTLYVDGVSRATTAYTAAWNASGPVMIGGRKDTGVAGSRKDMWHGGIDSVQIFAGALSPAQIDNLYTYGDAFYDGE